MTASSRIHMQAAVVAVIVSGLAAADWALAPAKASSWMIAIATGIGIWIVVAQFPLCQLIAHFVSSAFATYS